METVRHPESGAKRTISGKGHHRQKFATWIRSRWVLGSACVYVAAALFLVSALSLSSEALRLLSTKPESDRAASVFRKGDELMQHIAALNAAGRAYLVLRDPNILAEREKAKRSVGAQFAQLRRLVADDPDQLKNVETASRLAARRIELFDRMIADAGPPGTTVIAGEAERNRANRASYAALMAVREGASDKFFGYQREIADKMRVHRILATITGAFSPLLGLLGIYLLHREHESQKAREMQMELMHVQRLAIMGETSSMLAHEVNQPLAAASNYLSLMRRHLKNGATDTASPFTERIAEQVQRASGIVRKLRAFIEKRESERSPEPLNVLIDDAVTLLGTIDGTVTLKTEFQDGLPAVMVDRVQLQQVLVNLMRNAIEAMLDTTRRELTLSARASGRGTVEISLADTGPGLPKEVVERLFEPFVSTKPGGMGVGLSICQTIIANHRGRIWAEPNPGGGTVFRFTLPAAEERAAA